MVLRLLPFSLGYALCYLIRSASASLTYYPMAEDLGLFPGVLAALLGFAGAQGPLGRPLERYGPGPTLSGLFGLAVLGCGLAALAHGLGLLVIGRLTMGAGTALVLVGAARAYRTLRPQTV